MRTNNKNNNLKPYGKTRRLVSWILAFIMILSLLPAGSLFADYPQETGGAGATVIDLDDNDVNKVNDGADTAAGEIVDNNDGPGTPAIIIPGVDEGETKGEAAGDAPGSPGQGNSPIAGDTPIDGTVGVDEGEGTAGVDEGTGEFGGVVVDTVVAGDPVASGDTETSGDTIVIEEIDETTDLLEFGGEILAPGDQLLIRFYIEGVVYTSQYVLEGEYARFPGAPAKTLFPAGAVSFLGWYEVGAADDDPHGFTTPIMANLDLHARFSDMYLVQFLDGYGNVFISERVPVNGNATEPTQTQLDDMLLPPNTYVSYWTLSDTAPYDEYIFGAAPITDDTVFKPVLLEGVYVHFVSYGSEVPSVLVKPGERVSAPSPAPTRQYYYFEYWTTTPGGSGSEYDFMTPVTAGLTLYASWTGVPNSVPYRIVWWLETPNIGAGIIPTPGVAEDYEFAYETTKMGTPGENVTVSALPEDLAYVSGRPADINNPLYYSEFQYCADTLISGAGNTIVNVYLTRKTYRVTFDLVRPDQWLRYNGSTVNYSADELYIDFKYEQDISDIWPSKMTAEFSVGYNTDGNQYPFHSWQIPQTINGYLDSYGNAPVVWLTRRNIFSSDMLPKNPSDSGYTMTAYYDNVAAYNARYWIEPYAGQSLSGQTTRTYLSKTYILDTQYNQSNVSVIDFGKDINGVTCVGADYSMTETGQADPIFDNHLFQNFYYNRNKHDLIYNVGGGTSIATVQGIMFGQSLAAYKPNPDPTRNGFTFMGWFKDSLCTLAFDFDTAMMPANTNLIVFAKWESTDHTVTFYDGTEVLGTQGVATGAPVNFNNLWFNGVLYDTSLFIENKGVFIGWQYYPAGSSVLSPFPVDLLVYNDLNLYVHWRTDGFKVIYHDDGAEAGSTVPIDNNEYSIGTYARTLAGTMIAPDAGDTFIGWRTLTGTITYYPGSFIPITGDMHMYPRFVGASSLTNLIYDNNYPASPQTRTIPVEKNSTVPLTNETIFTITPPGQSFLGWQTEPNGGQFYNAYALFNIGADEVTLYAVWASNTVKLTYDGNGDMDATLIDRNVPRNTIYDVLGNAPTGLRKVGRELKGWTTAIDDQSTLITSTVYITNDMTVYALWSDYYVYVELTFDGNGDLDNTEVTIPVLIHDTVDLNDRGPKNLIKLGYDQAGWSLTRDVASTKRDTLQVSQDTTVYVLWGDGPLYVKITYNGNGDTANTNFEKEVLKYSTVTLADYAPTGLTKTYAVFGGWTLTKDDAATIATVLTRLAVDTTVYAYWGDLLLSDTPNINPINEGDKTVTGEGIPGAEIEITWPDGVTKTRGTVDPNGNWTIRVPSGITLMENDIVTAIQYEPGKRPSTPAHSTVGGGAKPGDDKSDTPNIDDIIEGDRVVSGNGEPGSEITVKFKDNSTVKTTVLPNRLWSVDVPAGLNLVEGDIVLAVQVTGNKLPSDEAQRTVLGTPRVKRSDTPNIDPIKDTDTKVTGQGVPGAEITVTWPGDDGLTTKTIVEPDGFWSVDVPAAVTLIEGDIITAVQTEPGKPDSLPAHETVNGDTKTGPRNDDKSDTPDIDEIFVGATVVTGRGTPGSEVVVKFRNGQTVRVIVGQDGKWSVDVPDGLIMREGDVVFAQQLTEDKKPSDWAQRTVIARRTPSAKPTVNPVTEEDTEVTGKGVPDAKITVIWPDGTTDSTFVDADGNWKVGVPSRITLKEGDKISVYQTEPGKGPSEQVDVYVQRKITPTPTPVPPAPTPSPSTGGSSGSPGSGTSGLPATPAPKVEVEDEPPPLIGFISQHIQYIKGYPEGTVMADVPITRAETAEVIYRLLEASLSGRQLQSPFPDVSTNAWYGESVAYLASIDILKGYLDGTFRPDNPITRAEFATMVSGFDHLVIVDYNVFPDVEGHWAVGYINSAAEKGWVSGYLDGTFRPEENITRAEVISVVNRMLNRKIHAADLPSWAPSYIDLTSSHWAYADIIEASIGHRYERKEDEFENWTERLR